MLKEYIPIEVVENEAEPKYKEREIIVFPLLIFKRIEYYIFTFGICLVKKRKNDSSRSQFTGNSIITRRPYIIC